MQILWWEQNDNPLVRHAAFVSQLLTVAGNGAFINGDLWYAVSCEKPCIADSMPGSANSEGNFTRHSERLSNASRTSHQNMKNPKKAQILFRAMWQIRLRSLQP